MESVDVVISGGGIIGLWTAYQVLQRRPELTVVLCEREKFLGEHSTGRNSEVLHSGVYYDYLSLKHQTCLEGNRLWREFVREQGLDFLDCGKFIVAGKGQEAAFQKLYQNAQANQVPGLRMATSQEINQLKAEVSLEMGFFCPSSGVLNVAQAVQCLSQLIEQRGGIILKSTELSRVEREGDFFLLKLGDESVRSRVLINASGHSAVDLRQQLGLYNYKNKRVKGSYLLLNNRLNLKSLIYPLPPADSMGLGVHLTLDVSGAQKFGPNTEAVDNINYSVDEDLIEEMFPTISHLFHGVQRASLSLAYSGIRPKILNEKNEIVKDFVLGLPENHGISNYYEFLGIESPGITSAPALARVMAKNF